MQTITALLVSNASITDVELPADLVHCVASISALVGGNFVLAFAVKLGGGATIVGLCKEPDAPAVASWSVVLEDPTLAPKPVPIPGPLVITVEVRGTGGDLGSVRSLTEEERERFTIDYSKGGIVAEGQQAKLLPTLRYTVTTVTTDTTATGRANRVRDFFADWEKRGSGNAPEN